MIAVAIAAVAGIATPVQAAEMPAASCIYEVLERAAPGWKLEPSRGSAVTDGTMTCTGSLDGHTLAGAGGRFHYSYDYDSSDTPIGSNTCVMSGGHGRWEIHVPTSGGGSLDMNGPFSFIYTGAAPGLGRGRLGDHDAYEVQAFYPPPDHLLDQNCVTQPVFIGSALGSLLIY
jgi:hypothetical protein